MVWGAEYPDRYESPSDDSHENGVSKVSQTETLSEDISKVCHAHFLDMFGGDGWFDQGERNDQTDHIQDESDQERELVAEFDQEGDEHHQDDGYGKSERTRFPHHF